MYESSPPTHTHTHKSEKCHNLRIFTLFQETGPSLKEQVAPQVRLLFIKKRPCVDRIPTSVPPAIPL